jgi:shikimate dehydrogenase
LYGLIGEKLGHSISPQIHSLIFKNFNIDGCYHLFEVKKEELESVVTGLKTLKAKGVNVTIPYKTYIMQYIDEISEEAQRIGAINTIHFSNGKTIGYNTDYYGFGIMLQTSGIKVLNSNVVVLGTGGSSKAVLRYLIDNGAKDIKVVTRNKNSEKYDKRINEWEVIEYVDLKNLKERDIVINCTPCGMYPDINNSPIDRLELKNFKVAIDLIYNPKQTLFLKYAEELGLKWVNGLSMLVGQAIVSQEIWNGIKIDRSYIYHICEKVADEIDKLTIHKKQ